MGKGRSLFQSWACISVWSWWGDVWLPSLLIHNWDFFRDLSHSHPFLPHYPRAIHRWHLLPKAFTVIPQKPKQKRGSDIHSHYKLLHSAELRAQHTQAPGSIICDIIWPHLTFKKALTLNWIFSAGTSQECTHGFYWSSADGLYLVKWPQLWHITEFKDSVAEGGSYHRADQTRAEPKHAHTPHRAGRENLQLLLDLCSSSSRSILPTSPQSCGCHIYACTAYYLLFFTSSWKGSTDLCKHPACVHLTLVRKVSNSKQNIL